MKRMVEAHSEGELVHTYPIILDTIVAPASDGDFIEAAKAWMLEDGQSPTLVEDWIVRAPLPGE